MPATPEGHERLLVWAARQAGERRFGLEDCRLVSRHLERHLLGRGEEVVRVAPHLAASFRRGGRRRGKSDGVDALAVARAALAEPDLPRARLGADERELRLLVDHREVWWPSAGASSSAFAGICTSLGHFETASASRALGGAGWLARLEELAGRPRRHPGALRPRPDSPACACSPREIQALEDEFSDAVAERGAAADGDPRLRAPRRRPS